MLFMKILCCTLFITPLLIGQITNPGFESWVTDPDGNINPVGWQTTNDFPVVSVEPFGPGCQGENAMKVKTLDMGLIALPGIAIMEAAYDFDKIPSKFGACVKANIEPGDVAYIIVALMRGDSVIALQDSCTFKIDSTISQFTYLEFPIAVQSSLLPDSFLIMVVSGLSNAKVGTEIIIDEIAFIAGNPTEVSEESGNPRGYLLLENYPNPFNPSTRIKYQVARNAHVSLKVQDLLGREVAVLVDEEQGAGSYEVDYDASQLTGGVYFCTLQNGALNGVTKMLLVR